MNLVKLRWQKPLSVRLEGMRDQDDCLELQTTDNRLFSVEIAGLMVSFPTKISAAFITHHLFWDEST